MTRVIFARKGKVVSIQGATFTALYHNLLKVGSRPKVFTLPRKLLPENLRIGDTVIWECVVPGFLSRITIPKPLEKKIMTMNPLSSYEPPKFLRKVAQSAAIPSKRYHALTFLNDEGKRKATGTCYVVFVADVMELFLELGCDVMQASLLTANWYHETAGGAAVCCENYGGIKAKPTNVQGRGWFLKYGHVNSGDAPIVPYVDFLSPEDCARYTLNTFAPKPEPAEASGWPDMPRTDGDYRAAGKAFHRVGNIDPKEWYPRIVDAGYKGNLTKTIPERRKASIDQFMIIRDTVERLYTNPFMEPKHLQSALTFLGRRDEAGVRVPYYQGEVDGNIGPLSKAALTAFQRATGLPQTGTYTSSTGRTLLRQLRLAYPL